MLELKNITKDYKVADDAVHALKGVSLSFREHEFVAILGQSGCGKTTLLNIIGGLDHYTSGELYIDGKSTRDYTDRDWDTYRNHRIGFVFQSYNLIPHQTISENVELALNISGVGKAERVRRAHEALDKVGLKDQYNKKPNQLSGGQMQRVAIARSLVNNPEILLADEPTGALDTATSVQIMDLIQEVSKQCLVIMVTHNAELAEKYATRTIRLLDGEVIDDSDPYDGAAEQENAELDAEAEKTDNAENTETAEKSDNAEKPEKKNAPSKKSRLSFWSAFKLSAKNLLSKLKRTVLVCIAGSIGIVGVATVLAVSSGVTNYIDDMQDDMLSGNPIMVSEEAFDLSAVLESTTAGQQAGAVKDSIEDGYINTEHLVDQLVQSSGQINNMTVRNDITKTYVDFVKEMPKEYYNAIVTYYGENMSNNLYTDFTYTESDGNGGTKHVSKNVSLSAATQVYLSMLEKTEQADFVSYIDMVSSSFAQAPDDTDFILSQYDIISDPATSKVATAADEIMIVVSDDNELTDLMLAQFGYYTQDEFFNVCYKAMEKTERYDEALWKERFSYDELLGKEFTWYPNDTVFTKNENPLTSQLNPFTYNAYSSEEWTTGKKLKITAILRPKKDLSYGCLAQGFYYTPALTEEVVASGVESEIRKYMANSSGMITSGKYKLPVAVPMLGLPAGSIVNNGITYNYDYYFEGENYSDVGFIGSIDSFTALMNSFMQSMGGGSASGEETFDQYVLSVRDIGGSDVPTSISIYPTNFDHKDEVTGYLNNWNSDGDITVGGSTVARADRTDVTYTDNLEIIIEMINSMIRIVTIALVAFTSLSLVVSTVMIAIITYVSVIERIKEIGVIRSLGGRKRDVSALFNAETFIIGGISGIIGIAITYLIEGILNLALGSAFGIYTIASLPIGGALIMIALSIVLTLISGLIPARLAAKKDPVVALRSE